MTLSWKSSLRSTLAAAFFLTLVAQSTVTAQCPSWDARFASWLPNGAVNALVQHNDGSGSKLYVGGEFTAIGPQSLAYLARWTGSAWEPVGGALDGNVRALFVHDFGTGPRLVAGGDFSNAGGQPASKVAVWDGASWSPLGAGFDAAPLTFASFDDGSGTALFAGGVFTTSAGNPARHIAKWTGSTWIEVGGGADGTVLALERRFTSLIVGGSFSHVGAQSIGFFAGWDGTSWFQPSPFPPNGTVRSLRTHATLVGDIQYVGGDFGSAGGSYTNRIAGFGGGSFWYTYPAGLLPDAVLCMESFQGNLFAGIDKLLGSSQLTLATTTGVSPGLGFVYAVTEAPEFGDNSFSGVVAPRALRVFDDGSGAQLYAGGVKAPGSAPMDWASNPLSRWNGERWTVVGPSQAVRVHGITYGPPSDPNYITRAVILDMETAEIGATPTSVYAAGYFDQAGQSYARSVARWDGVRWSALGNGLGIGPYDAIYGPGSVEALQAFNGGSGVKLFAGGAFASAGSPPSSAGGVASWDGTSWSSVGGGTDDVVHALGVFDEGAGARLFAGGVFTHAGAASALRIARWNGSAWSALGSGIDGPVYALLGFDDGSGVRLYAAGQFANAGGQGATSIARWNGTAWSAVGSGLAGSVRCLEALDVGAGLALYAGGRFTNPATSGIEGVARWNGASWTFLGLPTLDEVRALCTHDDGSGRALYAFGRLATAPNGGAIGARRWNGSAWADAITIAPPVSGLATKIFAARAWDDGLGSGPALLVGGDFTSVDGVESLAFAVQQSCRITSFCAGDGLDLAVTTSCPCSNFGAPGRGCAWHAGPNGAALATQGAIAPVDGLVLVASGMPGASSSIFLAGDALAAGGIVFGDGVRCVDGNLTRLGTKINVGGSARYPEAGNQSVSVRGHTPVESGLVGFYQTYYRNSAAFCTPATFNVTSGVKVVW